MESDPFAKSVDQTRLDRLRGEILAFVSDAESQGYSNMEIARALYWAACKRAEREDPVVWKSFLHFAIDLSRKSLSGMEELVDKFTKENEKNKIN